MLTYRPFSHLSRRGWRMAGAGPLAVALLLAGCGSGSTKSASTATTAKAAAGPGVATTVTAKPSAAVKCSASAYALLDPAGYTAATGETVAGVQDNGGVEGSGTGFVSEAKTATASGIALTVDLYTSDNKPDAQQIYTQFSGQGGDTPPSSVPGAGDAATYNGTGTFVQKGAQVLIVKAVASGAAEKHLEDIKLQGGDPRPAAAVIAQTSAKVAPALAAKMSGQACPLDETAFSLPAGAVDPCVLSASEVQQALPDGGAVRVAHQVTEEGPFQECTYTSANQGEILCLLATSAQLQAAVPPTDAATRYDTDRKALTQASDVPGVGDKAFATSQQGLLVEFLKGTKVAHCGGAGSSSTYPLASLGKVVKAYADKVAA